MARRTDATLVFTTYPSCYREAVLLVNRPMARRTDKTLVFTTYPSCYRDAVQLVNRPMARRTDTTLLYSFFIITVRLYCSLTDLWPDEPTQLVFTTFVSCVHEAVLLVNRPMVRRTDATLVFTTYPSCCLEAVQLVNRPMARRTDATLVFTAYVVVRLYFSLTDLWPNEPTQLVFTTFVSCCHEAVVLVNLPMARRTDATLVFTAYVVVRLYFS